MTSPTGTGVALVTPFNAKGQLDLDGLTALVHHCIAGGVDFLVAMGTTAESVTLSKEEKQDAIHCILSANQGQLPVVLGVGGNNTATVVEDFASIPDGIDAILSVSPFYNKPTQEGIYQHFLTIAAATDLPVILYNVPGRTASNVTAETTLRLAHDVENIVAVKEASGDMGQVMAIIKDAPEDFAVLSGDDNLTLAMLSMGGHGVISVSGQGFPKPFSNMVSLALDGHVVQARSPHYALLDITNMLFEEGNPAGIKMVLQELGVCESYVRQPLWAISEDLTSRICSATKALMD